MALMMTPNISSIVAPYFSSYVAPCFASKVTSYFSTISMPFLASSLAPRVAFFLMPSFVSYFATISTPCLYLSLAPCVASFLIPSFTSLSFLSLIQSFLVILDTNFGHFVWSLVSYFLVTNLVVFNRYYNIIRAWRNRTTNLFLLRQALFH